VSGGLVVGDVLENVGRDYVPTIAYGARVTVVSVNRGFRYAVVQDRAGARARLYRSDVQ